MGRKYSERRIYSETQPEVKAAVERAVYELGMEIQPEATDWEIKASHSISPLTWGERVTALMATSPGGGTQAVIESKLVFGFVDWGRNKKNVTAMFEAMETVLGPGESAAVEP